MALPSSGSLSFDQIRAELNGSGAISLGDSNVRGLAGKSSGPISFSDLRGKRNLVSTSFSYPYPDKEGANILATFPNLSAFNANITITTCSRDLFKDTTPAYPVVYSTLGYANLILRNASTKAVLVSSKIYYYYYTSVTGGTIKKWNTDANPSWQNFPAVLNIPSFSYSEPVELVLDLKLGYGQSPSYFYSVNAGPISGSVKYKSF